MRTSIILSALAFAAATLPANACSWSKTDAVAMTHMPTISEPVAAPVKVVALRDVWLERMVG